MMTVALGPFDLAKMERAVEKVPDKDRTHLRDLIELGMIDASWSSKYPQELALRLQGLLNNPQTSI
jgi:hypothetical protein